MTWSGASPPQQAQRLAESATGIRRWVAAAGNAQDRLMRMRCVRLQAS